MDEKYDVVVLGTGLKVGITYGVEFPGWAT